MKTYIFHVNGMHCKACIALIESELGDVPEVSKLPASSAIRRPSMWHAT